MPMLFIPEKLVHEFVHFKWQSTPVIGFAKYRKELRPNA